MSVCVLVRLYVRAPAPTLIYVPGYVHQVCLMVRQN